MRRKEKEGKGNKKRRERRKRGKKEKGKKEKKGRKIEIKINDTIYTPAFLSRHFPPELDSYRVTEYFNHYRHPGYIEVRVGILDN